MPTLKEKTINNTFQILEDLKGLKIRRCLKRSFIRKRKSRSSKAQPPGKVKIFSEEEVFLYKIRKYKQTLLKEE